MTLMNNMIKIVLIVLIVLLLTTVVWAKKYNFDNNVVSCSDDKYSLNVRFSDLKYTDDEEYARFRLILLSEFDKCGDDEECKCALYAYLLEKMGGVVVVKEQDPDLFAVGKKFKTLGAALVIPGAIFTVIGSVTTLIGITVGQDETAMVIGSTMLWTSFHLLTLPGAIFSSVGKNLIKDSKGGRVSLHFTPIIAVKRKYYGGMLTVNF